jgi:hypothetical protein
VRRRELRSARAAAQVDDEGEAGHGTGGPGGGRVSGGSTTVRSRSTWATSWSPTTHERCCSSTGRRRPPRRSTGNKRREHVLVVVPDDGPDGPVRSLTPPNLPGVVRDERPARRQRLGRLRHSPRWPSRDHHQRVTGRQHQSGHRDVRPRHLDTRAAQQAALRLSFALNGAPCATD